MGSLVRRVPGRDGLPAQHRLPHCGGMHVAGHGRIRAGCRHRPRPRRIIPTSTSPSSTRRRDRSSPGSTVLRYRGDHLSERLAEPAWPRVRHRPGGVPRRSTWLRSASETGIVGTFGGINIAAGDGVHGRLRLGCRPLQRGQRHRRQSYSAGTPTPPEGLFTNNFESLDDGRAFAQSLVDEGADIVIFRLPDRSGLGMSAAVCQETGACTDGRSRRRSVQHGSRVRRRVAYLDAEADRSRGVHHGAEPRRHSARVPVTTSWARPGKRRSGARPCARRRVARWYRRRVGADRSRHRSPAPLPCRHRGRGRVELQRSSDRRDPRPHLGGGLFSWSRTAARRVTEANGRTGIGTGAAGHHQAVPRRARQRSRRPSSVRSGEILGLLGENGAGKTTLMNILYGLVPRRRG